jgi:prepilin-type N-terminal cleavage/methylation domain-containing protein
MNTKNRQINKGLVLNKTRGFTLVEAIIAIFILSISVTSMLGLTASSFSSARYANNEITANYLLQEAIDSVRNSRDTIAFQEKNNGGGWAAFLNRYGYPSNTKCFSTNGCVISIDRYSPDSQDTSEEIKTCNQSNPSFGEIRCPSLVYDEDGSSGSFYNQSSDTTLSNFKRQVRMTVGDSDKVTVVATVEWKNGNSVKSRSLETVLLNWKQ